MLLPSSRVPEAERCFCGEPESAWAMFTGRCWKWCWGFLNDLHGDGIMLSIRGVPVSLSSYACTFKIRVKKKKSPVSPFTDVMVLCHPSGKEAAGLAPLVCAHRCWHQLCSALGQQASGLPACGVNSKWRTTLSPNCPQASAWMICGTSEFLLHTGMLAPHWVTAARPAHGRMRRTASSLRNRPVSAPMPVFRHHQGLVGRLSGKGARRGLGPFLAFSSCVLGFPVSIKIF